MSAENIPPFLRIGEMHRVIQPQVLSRRFRKQSVSGFERSVMDHLDFLGISVETMFILKFGR